MTENETQQLRQLASQATPGPWLLDAERDRTVFSVSDGMIGGVLYNANGGADAAYIAAANPTRILSLLDDLKANQRLREALEELYRAERDRSFREVNGGYENFPTGEREIIEGYRAEYDAATESALQNARAKAETEANLRTITPTESPILNLRSQLTAAEATIAELRLERVRMNTALLEASEYIASGGEQRKELQSEITSLRSQVERLTRERDRLREHNASQNAKIERQRAELTSLQKRHDDQSNRANRMEIAYMQPFWSWVQRYPEINHSICQRARESNSEAMPVFKEFITAKLTAAEQSLAEVRRVLERLQDVLREPAEFNYETIEKADRIVEQALSQLEAKGATKKPAELPAGQG